MPKRVQPPWQLSEVSEERLMRALPLSAVILKPAAAVSCEGYPVIWGLPGIIHQHRKVLGFCGVEIRCLRLWA